MKAGIKENIQQKNKTLICMRVPKPSDAEMRYARITCVVPATRFMASRGDPHSTCPDITQMHINSKYSRIDNINIIKLESQPKNSAKVCAELTSTCSLHLMSAASGFNR